MLARGYGWRPFNQQSGLSGKRAYSEHFYKKGRNILSSQRIVATPSCSDILSLSITIDTQLHRCRMNGRTAISRVPGHSLVQKLYTPHKLIRQHTYLTSVHVRTHAPHTSGRRQGHHAASARPCARICAAAPVSNSYRNRPSCRRAMVCVYVYVCL